MKRAAALALLLALLFFAFGFAQPRYGGVLRAGMQTDPVGLDPHLTSATATRNMMENVYDTLVMFDSSGRLVPGLAESWEASDDGLRWTFTLREGVTFHNGEPLKASDVVFSINRIKDPEVGSPRAGQFTLVEQIEAPDERTVVFTLSRPFTPLLANLAFSTNVILSEAVIREHGDAQRVVVGTGPFKFVEYLPQTRLVLERNADYWGTDEDGNPLPYLDGITFTFYPDPAARTTAIQTASVDFIEYVPAADVLILEADPSVEVVGGLSANFRSLYLNTTVPPLDDVRVRQAIAHAIDEQEIVDLALFGTGGIVATGTTIPAGNYYAIEANPYTGRNLERARELLDEAGYAGGFELNIYVTTTYDFLRDPAEVIQANLADVGIRATITAEDWGVYLPKALNSEFQTTILGTSGQADPDEYLFSQFHSSGTFNLSKLYDDELDALLERGRAEADPEVRREIYLEAQARILELAPHVFLFHSAQYEALQSYVRGFEHFPNTSYLGLRTTWLDR
jgi:peptide/nickel transport system substrate-binding protein